MVINGSIKDSVIQLLSVISTFYPAQRSQRLNDRLESNFSQPWKENNNRTPPNQTNLVVSGVELDIRGKQIAQYIENKVINMYDWSLCTTRYNASFLAFKITLKRKTSRN